MAPTRRTWTSSLLLMNLQLRLSLRRRGGGPDFPSQPVTGHPGLDAWVISDLRDDHRPRRPSRGLPLHRRFIIFTGSETEASELQTTMRIMKQRYPSLDLYCEKPSRPLLLRHISGLTGGPSVR